MHLISIMMHAYNMNADMADFHYICVFLVYKIKAYAKIEHWERNYLISNCCGNGAYVSSFDSTASFGSDQKLTLGSIIDGGDVPFLGTIAAMETYIGITEGVPDHIKKEIMKAMS